MKLSGSNKDIYQYVESNRTNLDDLFNENAKVANLFVIKMLFGLCIVSAIWLIYFLCILNKGSSLTQVIVLGSVAIVCLITALVFKNKIDKSWLRYVLLAILLVCGFAIRISVTNVTLLCFAIPVILTCRYFDEKYTLYVSLLSLVLGIVSIFVSFIITLESNIGISVAAYGEEFSKKDILLTSSIFYVIEFTTLYFAIASACYMIARSSRRLIVEQAITRGEKENALKQAEESKMEIMISQIQPHFLYNALNSIYYLVDKDQKKAKKSIADFSDYLRANLNFSKKSGLVPFSEEMNHIEKYLSLEKVRFEEDLNIVYDLKFTHFRVPSLSLQPLVENAVKHGITKKFGGGTLTIKSYEVENSYMIEIIDDGVGFDVNQSLDDDRKHIGLENSKYRLRTLTNAKIDVESKIGYGTKITISIPKEYYYEDNSSR